MASDLTDDLILSDRLIRRRYVQIPKDQREQLDNAWSETLSRGQHPMFNIPYSVLQDVKDLHIRNHAKSKPQPASSAQQPSIASSASVPPRSSRQEPPNSNAQHDGGGGDDDDDDEQVSWVETPEQHSFGSELSAEDELIRHQDSSPPKSPSPPHFTNTVPQSSGVNSEGLEIEPPGYVTQVMEPPVNRTALRVTATASGKPEPTPPSAQVPVGTGEHLAAPPPAKRRRVTEDTRLSGNASRPVELVAASKPSETSDNSNQNSLTTNISASNPSLGTQSAKGRPAQPGEPKVMSDPAPFRSFTPTFEGRQRETAAQHLVITGSTTSGLSYVPPPAQRKTPVKGPSPSHMRPSQEPRQKIRASPAASYEAYRLAYPDYSRSSRDFVIALLSVKQLKCDRALHEFLYDDFIRAYSSDYFAYVSECSRKQVGKILPGIQWYNDNVRDVLYTKHIVRKSTLSDFLETHSEEAHSIKGALEYSQSTDSVVEDSDDEMEDAFDGDEDREDEELVPESGQSDKDEAETRASPELDIESPKFITKSPWYSKQTSVRLDSPTRGVEQHDEQMEDLAGEEDVQQPLINAGESGRSQGSRMESPNPATVTSTSNGLHNPQAHESPTLTPAKSFASQENVSDFWRTRLSSSPAIARVTNPRTQADKPTLKMTQKGPASSPLERAAEPSSPKGSRKLLAGDEHGGDEEDASEPSMPPSPLRVATLSSLKRSQTILRSNDDEGHALEPPMLPSHRDAGPLCSSKSRIASTMEDGNDPSEMPSSPLLRSVERLPKSRLKQSAVDDEDDTDQDDAFEPPPPKTLPSKKVTHSVPASKATPIPSTAIARPMSSTMPAAKPPVLGQRSVTGPTKAVARFPNASSVSLGAARRHSAASSVGSSAVGPQSKKRLSETPEQRRLRLKAFMEEQMELRKRASSGAPASTFSSSR